jgi:hypothetical protein
MQEIFENRVSPLPKQLRKTAGYDLTTSYTLGSVWSCSFTGTSVKVIAPKEAGAGKIDVRIDGETRATVVLSTRGIREAQQVVCEVTGLTPGKHAISIINRGQGLVAVDAIVVGQARREISSGGLARAAYLANHSTFAERKMS